MTWFALTLRLNCNLINLIKLSVIQGVTTLKENLVLRFERREVGRMQGTYMTKNFSGKIESQDDFNGNSPSLWSSLYSLLISCPIVWSRRSITQLVVVDRVIYLPWDHSIDDNSAVSSDIFLSWDTWKPCKFGTSCSMYALDSSRTTPLVEEVLRQDVIHFSWIPMSRAGVSHQWGHFWRETSFSVWLDKTFTYLARSKE
jgi:hypothetical protein